MKLKSILIFVFVFFLAFFALLIYLPSLASTHWGNAQLLKAINSFTSNTVKADQISLSWLGPQSISGVEITNPQGKPLLSFEKASLNSSLTRLIWNKMPEGDLQLSSLQASIAQEPQVTSLRDVNLRILFDSNDRPLTLHLSGVTEHDNLSGKFQVGMELAGLKTGQLIHFDRTLFELLRETPEAQLKIKADISNFPVILLDQSLAFIRPELSGILVSALGENLNFAVDQSLAQDNLNLFLQAQSQRLNAKIQMGLNPLAFSLKEPGKIFLQITPEFSNRLTNVLHLPSKWRLAQTALTEISLDQFKLPLEYFQNKILPKLDALLFKAELKLPQADLVNDSTNEKLSLQQLAFDLEKLGSEKIVTTVLSGEVVRSEQIMPFKTSPMKWDIGERLTLLQPGSLQADLNASILNQSLLRNIPAKLQNNPSAEIVLQQFSTPLAGFDPDATNLRAEIKLSSLLLNQIPTIGQAQVNHLKMNIFGDSTRELQCECQMEITQAEGLPLSSIVGSPLQIFISSQMGISSDKKLDIKHFDTHLKSDFATAHLEGKIVNQNQILLATPALINYTITPTALNFLKMPATSVQATPLQITLNSPTPIDLSNLHLFHLLGQLKIDELILTRADHAAPLKLNSINLMADANINLAQSQEGILKLKINSDQVNAQATLKINEAISLQNDDSAFIRLTLTPQGYTAIRNYIRENTTKEIILTEPSTVEINLKSLHLPLNRHDEQVFPWWKGAISADVKINHLHVFSPISGKQMNIKDLKGQVSSELLSNKIYFQVNAENSIDVSGMIENGFTEEGLVNRDSLSAETAIKLNALPADLLSQLLCFDPTTCKKIQIIFGEKIDGDIRLKLKQMEGPVYAGLKGKNGQLFLEGQIINKHLTLNKAFELSVVLTPDLGQYVLQDYFPFLSGMISSNQPLKITLDPKEFSLPLFPLNAIRAEISRGTIDLGKVQLANSGQLGNVISLIAPIKQDFLSVWFTPIYFSMHDGALKLERVDMLIGDQYPIAAWGKVNLVKDKVNMIIALSGLAISKAFNASIQDKNYFLQLPLKGTLSNASIDKSKATSRISSLIAQNHGSPHGFLIGTFLDIANGNISEKKTPPPTTNPLPWSNMLQDETKPTENSINPLQQLEKGANSLLKSIFN